MRLFHGAAGIALLVFFLITGQYMQHALNSLQDLPDGPRMIYRSAHIYLLLIALVHLALGLARPATGAARWFAGASSVLSLPVTLLLIFGFFRDADTGDLSRPIGRYGLYGCFGIGLLLALRWRSERRSVS